MRHFAAVAALCISGCASVSDVTQTGPTSYMVGSNARGGFKSDAEVKALAINRAQEFCARRGEVAEVMSSTSSGVQMWTPQNAEVNFKCAPKP
jgi:hypothetical protein